MLRRIILALLSGALLALAFPPAEWWPLAFVGLVPLIEAVRGAGSRRGFLLGWLAGLAFFSGVVWWVTVAIVNYGYLPLPVGWGIMFLMTSVLALYPGIFGALAASAHRRGRVAGPAGVLLLAAAWTGLEWVRGSLPVVGFAWANLAYTQYARLPFIQSAALTGPWGPSFVVVAVNVAAWGGLAAMRRGELRRRALTGAAVAGALAAASLGYGMVRLREPVAGGPDKAVRVAVLQGNIDQTIKWDRRFRESTLESYLELTREAAADGADLAVWPESAAPFYFQEGGALQDRLLAGVREAGIPVLFGAPAYEAAAGGRPQLRNRAWYLGGGGSVGGWYDKTHLVPFGEYVPCRRLLSFAGKLVQEVGDFTPGEGPVLFRLDGEHFGTVICYEIIFPDLVRRHVRDGAVIMTTVTNDAWYGRTSASWQHFTQMVFRAVENGVPVARAANTGISGFVDARGRVLEASPLFIRGEWTADLLPGSERTPYTRWGDWFAWLCLAGCAAWVARKPVPGTNNSGNG